MFTRFVSRSFSGFAGKRILVTGANGQIGTALLPLLYEKCGVENVIASDLQRPRHKIAGSSYILDVTSETHYEKLVKELKIDYIVHMASVLSAVGEQYPMRCRDINNIGFQITLDLAKKYGCQVFAPSSIAAFGDKCPKENVPEDPALLPRSMYGVTKVYNELLGRYYYMKFGVDFRSIRYPGIISSEEYEYHGTTDYSTEIFFKALREKKYQCFLRADTPLPLIHMEDALKATMELMGAENSSLTRRVYNLAGLSLTPKDFVDEIKKTIPEFECTYKPDFRQAIADSWPASINDQSNADWGWHYSATIKDLCAKMFSDIKRNEAMKPKD